MRFPSLLGRTPMPAAVLSGALFLGLGGTQAHVAQAQTTLVSAATSGQSNGLSLAARTCISGNGRYVAFTSAASNLVPNDTNGKRDVFVRDLTNNTTRLVSVATSGTQGDGDSSAPSISNDGRYVVFLSDATNLVSNDTNNFNDIFLRDLTNNTTIRVSVTTSGAQGDGASTAPNISADGSRIAFTSAAKLAANDNNDLTDIFVRDLASGTTILASPTYNGAPSDNNSQQASLSANGRYVVYYSPASNMVAGDTNNAFDVFLRDLTTNTTTLVSVTPNGTPGDGNSFSGILSADGTKVAFYSLATNLVANDTNANNDVFVRDLTTNTTRIVSVDSNGAQGSGSSTACTISADGSKVAFGSGSSFGANDSNGAFDVFLRDLNANTTTLISANPAGTTGNGLSSTPSISADGSKIAFESLASDLVPNDTNGFRDVFVRGVAAAVVNNDPTLDAIGNVSYKRNGGAKTVSLSGITDGDTGATQTLSVSANSSNTGVASVGVNYTPSNSTGSLTITPTGEGSTTITVTVTDNGSPNKSTQRSFTVTISNTAPVANPQTVSVTKNTATPITLTGSDADIDSLTYTVLTSPQHGTLSGTAPNLTYTPTTGYSGADSFTFRVNDGSANSNTATVTLNVTNVAPVLSNIEGAAVAYTQGGSATQITNTLAVSDSDSPNLTGATVRISSGLVSSEDRLVFTNQNGITGSYNTSTGVLTLSGTATVAQYQAALRSVAYQNTNSANPNTSDRTISFQVQDEASSNNLSNTTTRSISITQLNKAPVNSVPGAQSTSEDQSLVFSAGNGNAISISDADAGSGSLTVNLSVTNGVFAQSNASTLTLNGTLTAINAALATLTYVPTPNFFGTSTLTITTNDNGNNGAGGAQSDTDTVNITVTPVNDNPTASNDSATVAEDSAATVIDVLANDSIAPDTGETLSVSSVMQPSHGTVTLTGGVVRYRPATNYNGSDSFTYTISDGNGGTATATVNVTVTAVNDAPVVDSVTITPTNPNTNSLLTATVTASDVENDTLTYTYVWKKNGNVINGQTGKTLNLATAGNGDNGDIITVTVMANDGSANSAAVTSNAVTIGNSAPVISSVTITPGNPNTNSTLTATVAASDADSDALSYSYVWRKNGSVISGETGKTLDLSKAGNGDKGDSITVTVTATDGTATSTAVVSNSVSVVNSAPVISSVTITPSAPLTTSLLTANVVVSDIDNDTLSYSYVWKKNGSILVGETGKTLDLSKAGNGDDGDSITVTVTANDGEADSASVTSASVSISNRTPQVDAVSPQGATDKVGDKRTFSITVSDENGASDIKETWLLVNERLNWSEGATFIYVPSAQSPTSGLLYLRRGDAFLPPIQVGAGASSTDVLDNGAVRVVGSDVTVTVSGNSLTLSIPATIREGLVGNNTLFGFVLDKADATDARSQEGDMGFVRFGSYSVTSQFSGPNVAPVLSKLSPGATYTALGASGVAPGAQRFVFYVSDDNGISDIESVWFLAGKQLNWTNSATIVYQPRTRRLFLRSDDGTTFLGGGQIGQVGILENSQVRIDLSKVSVNLYPDGKSFGLTLFLQAKAGLLGQNTIWLRAQDKAGLIPSNSNPQGYVQSGTWSVVQGSSPAGASSPSNGNS